METLGLTSAAAIERLKTYGYNELPHEHEAAWFVILSKIVREPMFLLLAIGAILYFILGSKIEASMLLSFVVVIVAITFFQERKSERAVIALRNLSSPRAFVIRDGIGKRIAGREVVPDDIIILNEGDCVPADAVLLNNESILLDESILTGESRPVTKQVNPEFTEICRPGGNDLPLIYSGTYVIQGKGTAKVIATGQKTEVGKIGTALSSTEIERSNLQKESDTLIRTIAIWSFAICLLVAIIYSVNHANWLQGMLVGITLAMAVLPEEFPVILTVFLALGAWRIAKRQVLTRRIPAIEALGSATVLCVDKTGTITQNRMAVVKLFAQGNIFNVVPNEAEITLPEQFHQILQYSILASHKNPFDPMEIAVKKFGEHCLRNSEHLHEQWQLVHQYPLSRELLALSQVWQSTADKGYVIATKGAPEAIFELCHLSLEQGAKLAKQVAKMAAEGLRVIGVAKAKLQQQVLPEEQHDFNFEFVGLIGFADPVRPNVAEAVANCYSAGVRVIMITGDYAGTAQNIARKIGLHDAEEVILGSQLAQMNDLELRQRIKSVNIFARILPEQKLRIVNALKANGEIVAMTGDGVNDAPALKSAHIGVAMGSRGTDVAREAAALVLLDDDFTAIAAAIRLGRRIFDNIKKATTYTLAAHIPIIGMSLLPALFKWPLMLLPIHIVFIELVIDPTCSIVFEAEQEENNVMQRPPRSEKEKLFGVNTLISGLCQGFSILLVLVLVFLVARAVGYSDAAVRSLVFTMLVAGNIGLIFANRAWSYSWEKLLDYKNKALWLVVGVTLTVLMIVLHTPILQQLFHFAPLNFGVLVLGILTGVCSGFWFKFARVVG